MTRLCFLPLLLFVVLPAACTAEPDPEPFTVIVPASSLEVRTAGSGTLANHIGMIVATAAGEMCTSVDVVGAAHKNDVGDVVILIGEKDQPEPCRTEGAKVVLLQPRGAGTMLGVLLGHHCAARDNRDDDQPGAQAAGLAMRPALDCLSEGADIQ